MNSKAPPIYPPHKLSLYRLGVGCGTAGAVFYIGCFITMTTVPRDKAVVFFNSLLHGLDVGPVLRDSVPASEFFLGIVSTFILTWLTGVIIAGVYNCCARGSR